MKRYSAAPLQVRLVVCLAAWLSGGATIVFAVFSTRVLPVPVNVEGEKIFTALHLQLAVEDLGFDLIGRPDLEGELAFMVGFLEEVLTDQTEAALAQTWTPVQVDVEQVRELLQQYHEVFAEHLGTIRVEKLVALGEERLLLWSFAFPDPDHPYPRVYRSLRFVRPQNGGGELLFEGVLRDPLAVLVNSVYEEAQRFSGPIPEGDPAGFAYAYPYPPHQGPHAAEFLFNGETMEVDALGLPPSDPPPAPVAFYREAMQALVGESATAYAAFLGPDSRRRVLEFARLRPEDYDNMTALVRDVGKKVFFLLDADPVSYVFYLPSRPGIEGAPFSYDMIWRDPAGDLHEVNVFRESFFDDIIKVRGLFEEPFLRPTLIAADLLTDERTPLRVAAVNMPTGEPAAAAAPAETLPPPPAASVEPERKGLPWWVWALLALLLAALTFLFWRQRAKSPDA